ncbi:hypothetical protein R6Q57_012719 [Mikania cordata]
MVVVWREPAPPPHPPSVVATRFNKRRPTHPGVGRRHHNAPSYLPNTSMSRSTSYGLSSVSSTSRIPSNTSFKVATSVKGSKWRLDAPVTTTVTFGFSDLFVDL